MGSQRISLEMLPTPRSGLSPTHCLPLGSRRSPPSGQQETLLYLDGKELFAVVQLVFPRAR